ncbi:MAG: HigA family addiction module antitoxin [Clostridia bacterium]|nr:HigA family addiction module antitoxin [Clostridia bacterium]
MTDNKTKFKPQFAIPPGETVLETIEAIGMSQAELAARTGRPLKTINEIIKGKTAITPETALQFERVLGVSATFWNNLETNYREALATIEERNRLEKQVEWLRYFPLKKLYQLGAINKSADPVEGLTAVLNFFGVSSPDAWEKLWLSPEVAFRKSPVYQSSPYTIATWMRLGEIAAQKIKCQPYDKEKFKQAIVTIRELTIEDTNVWYSEVIRLCAEGGVAVIFVPELPKTHVSGVTRWLSDKKALIQLSLRHKTNDHLWFTFFHEAAHILLHGKKDVFIEGAVFDSEKEEEANRFSREFLIPPQKFREFLKSTSRFSQEAILLFAKSINVAPGIVVGRLQHDSFVPRSHFNKLKQYYKFEWITDK